MPAYTVKQNTRDSYTDSLKIVEATVGARVVRNVTVIDVKRWYRNWRQPKKQGAPERIKRAHDAVTTFRMILRFGFALGFEECGKLAERLTTQQFEKSALSDHLTHSETKTTVRYIRRVQKRTAAVTEAATVSVQRKATDAARTIHSPHYLRIGDKKADR